MRILRNLFTLLQKQPIRWLCLAVWVIASLALLLKPGKPPTEPSTMDPVLLELLMITGHLVTFSGLTGWLWWALQPYWSNPRALKITVILAMIFNPVTELLQSFSPHRNVSLFDIATNTAAILIAAALIRHYTRPH
jgi:VanZ family protein